jgi:hypothetical protein
MITEIHSRLKNDCDSYKKQLNAAKNNLANEIKRMKRLFMGGVDDSAQITSYKMIGTFLKTFPQEFLKFRDHFLFPDLNKYRQVLDFLGSREGQRWWIHFQDGDMYGLTPGIKKITERIEMYCSQSSLARQAFAGDLQQLQKLLELGGAFPVKQLSRMFISKNVRLNSILIGSQPGKDTGTSADIRSHLGGLLESVSAYTGGKTILTAHPEQGIKDITKHRDHYYRLIYPFQNGIRQKKVQVKITPPDKYPNLKLSYQEHFNENEMASLIRLSSHKIRISGVSLNQPGDKRIVKFSIQSVTFNKEKKFGLVKVRIELFDNRENSLYRTENTLRSSKSTITISVPLPVRTTGSAKLRIQAYDLIANRLASWEEPVTLE